MLKVAIKGRVITVGWTDTVGSWCCFDFLKCQVLADDVKEQGKQLGKHDREKNSITCYVHTIV